MLVRLLVPILYLYQKLKHDDGDDDDNAWNIYQWNKYLQVFVPLAFRAHTMLEMMTVMVEMMTMMMEMMKMMATTNSFKIIYQVLSDLDLVMGRRDNTSLAERKC